MDVPLKECHEDECGGVNHGLLCVFNAATVANGLFTVKLILLPKNIE
jgi:hypothetical protein